MMNFKKWMWRAKTSFASVRFCQILLKCIVSLCTSTSNVEVCFYRDFPKECVVKVFIGEKGYQVIVLMYKFLIINKVQQCFIFLGFIGYHFLKKIFICFAYFSIGLFFCCLMIYYTLKLSFICNTTIANISFFKKSFIFYLRERACVREIKNGGGEEG